MTIILKKNLSERPTQFGSIPGNAHFLRDGSDVDLIRDRGRAVAGSGTTVSRRDYRRHEGRPDRDVSRRGESGFVFAFDRSLLPQLRRSLSQTVSLGMDRPQHILPA